MTMRQHRPPTSGSANLGAASVDISAFLKDIQPELEASLKKRFPLVRAEHDDLISETLSGIAAWVQRSPPAGVDDLRRVAWAILNRRLADFFRKRLPATQESDSDGDEALALLHVEGEGEHRIDVTRLFSMTSAILAAMPADDVDLLIVGPQTALSDKDRQRLHRIRVRLAAEIRRRYGIAPRHLLGDE